MAFGNLRYLLMVLLAMVLIFAFAGCDCGDDDDDSGGGDDDDTGDDDDDTSSDDDDDDDTADDDDAGPEEPPLSKTLMTLSYIEEVALIHPGVDDTITGWVWDDEYPDGAKKAGDDDDAVGPREEIGTILDKLATDELNGRLVQTLTGDLDADGKDEIVVASIYTADNTQPDYRFDHIKLTILDDSAHGFAVLKVIDTSLMTIDALNPDVDSFLTMDFTIADLDGTEGDEIVLVGVYGRIAQEGSGNTTFQHASLVFAFDDAANSYAEIFTEPIKYSGAHDMKVAAGDLDGDFKDEIVLYSKVNNDWLDGWVLDDQTADFVQIHYFHETGHCFENWNYWYNVEMTDVDNDGIDEAVFVANHGYEFYLEIYKMNTEGGFDRTRQKHMPRGGSYAFMSHEFPNIGVGDFDGNGTQDVVITPLTDHPSTPQWLLMYYYPDSNGAGNIGLGYDNEIHLAVGDTDRDGKDEFYITYAENDEYHVEEWQLVGKGFEKTLDWSQLYTTEYYPLAAIGDFDGDNMVVRYTGEHWMSISDPRIAVALAMPPVWLGINQDRSGSTSVGYGESTSFTEEIGSEVSVSAGLTLSVSGGDPFGIVEFEASTTLEKEFTKTQTSTSSVSLGIKRNASWSDEDPQNYVVFSATTYHCYKYKIIAHPDPEFLEPGNEFMTIDVPIETNTYKKSISAYNDGGDYMEIGLETFSHTLGDPTTYKTIADRDEILYAGPIDDDDDDDDDDDQIDPGPIYDENMGASGWSMPPQGQPLIPVDEGPGGGTELSVTLSESNSSGTSRSLGVTMTAGLSVAGVGFEASVGYKNTDVYTVTVGQTTSYYGSVGEIQSVDYDDYFYKFGMFVYNFLREDGMKYQIIDWCAEEL